MPLATRVGWQVERAVMNERHRALADPLAEEGEGRHGGHFNASLAAGLLWVVAVVPAFFLSFFWLPFAGVILLAALVLAIVALTQGRVLGGVLNLVCVLLVAPVGIFIGVWAVPLYLAKVSADRQAAEARTQPPRPSVVPAKAPEEETATTPRPSSSSSPRPLSLAGPTPTPRRATVIATEPVPPAGSPFDQEVIASQRRAVAAHPDLAKATSALNLRFRVRHDDWRSRGDIRLSRPDWPERLADEVATSR